MRVLPAAIALLVCVAPCRAQLEWSSTTAVHRAAPDETQWAAEFPFVNMGPRTVRVEEIDASCGCTAAVLEQQVFAPGEGGTILAVLRYGSRTGELASRITVKTNDPVQPKVVLSLNATVPELLSADPPSLQWLSGEDLAPKRVRVRVRLEAPALVRSVASNSGHYAAEVRAVRPGWEYEVTVTPGPEVRPGDRAVITLTTNAHGTRAERLEIGAGVARPRSQPVRGSRGSIRKRR